LEGGGNEPCPKKDNGYYRKGEGYRGSEKELDLMDYTGLWQRNVPNVKGKETYLRGKES